MTTTDLRVAYKRYSGNLPFMTEGNYQNEQLRDPYFQWLEELVLKYIKEEDVKQVIKK